jgi:hypothetical protein
MVSGKQGVSGVYAVSVNVGVPAMNVILVCPICKRRKLYAYDDWVRSCHPLTKSHQRIRCDNDCGFMVYHKDVKE